MFIIDRMFQGKDFQIKWINPSLFLMLMSIFKNANSLKIKIFPLLIISQQYYEILDFKKPKLKYLLIDWYSSPYYPVNTFKDDEWLFDSILEKDERLSDISLSAYAIFMFLVNSNFIYSLKEIKVIWASAKDSFEKDFNNLFENFKNSSKRKIKLEGEALDYKLMAENI